MKRTWTIIGVSDVAGSFKWYQSLFGQPETPPGHDYFGQIVDTDGTVLLCLHQWGAHEHPSLMSPDEASPGNGLLLFFRVDDFDMALKRALALVARFEEEPHVNPNTQTLEFSLRDPDGYYVAISALPAPQRKGPRGGGLTSACSRRRRAAESESHRRNVSAFAAEALFVKFYLHGCCDSSRYRPCPDRGYVELD
jgi:catechol 2,3-dioxygenase-like lactoylglutathione lyase family enzyme